MKIEKTPSGYFVTHADDLGAVEASIIRPEKYRPHWALAYAACTGRYAEKQGKYETYETKRAAVAALEEYLQVP